MRLCTISGCESKAVGRGWCNKHYHRFRSHGNPLAIARTETGEPAAWIEWALAQETDECLLWPFPSTRGGVNNESYGALDGNRTAHKTVCERAHGPCPPNMETRHLCGKGLCCNKRHLIWGEHWKNEGDKLTHGTRK